MCNSSADSPTLYPGSLTTVTAACDHKSKSLTRVPHAAITFSVVLKLFTVACHSINEMLLQYIEADFLRHCT